MANGMDDLRRGKEEEYFHRKNQEAIEKLREKMKIAAAAKEAGTSTMQCPRCDGKLHEAVVAEVTLDSCDKCGGVWLDSGELAELTTKKDPGGWFKRLWGAEG